MVFKTSTRQRGCTALTFLANGFGMGVWSVEIATVQADIEASNTAIGIALLIFALSALIAMQISGRVSGYYPLNRICAVLGIVFAASLAALGFVSSWAGLCITLALFGLAHGALDVAMNARASLIEKRAGRPMMSSFHAAWSIGGLFGAGLAGLLSAQNMAPAFVLWLTGCIALPVLLAAGIAYTSAETAERGLVTGRRNPAVRNGLSLRIVLLCLIAFLALLTEGALANWSSIYLNTVLSGLSGGFAIGYMAFSAGMSVGRLGGDTAITWFGHSRVGIVGAGAASVSFAIVLGFPSYITAAVGFVLIGLGMSNIVPITFSIAGCQGQSSATGIARATSAGYTGFVVGPPLIGGLAGVTSLAAALALLIGSTAAIATIGLFAFRDRAIPHQTQGERGRTAL